MSTSVVSLDSIIMEKLSQDVKEAANSLTIKQGRYLVDLYYMIQKARVGMGNRSKALEKFEEPNEVIAWVGSNMDRLEVMIKSILDRFTNVEASGMGVWAKDITGIGPVISAGLICYIDITKAPAVSHIWALAGLRPGQRRKQGEKINWNPGLKRLSYLMGESFVKVKNHEKDIYGKFYDQRKQYETERNEKGLYAEQAKEALKNKRFGEDTIAKSFYVQGKLPPGHIHARAKRWTVKLFLAHWWEEAYKRHYKTNPPAPYAIQFLGHVDKIEFPGSS